MYLHRGDNNNNDDNDKNNKNNIAAQSQGWVCVCSVQVLTCLDPGWVGASYYYQAWHINLIDENAFLGIQVRVRLRV